MDNSNNPNNPNTTNNPLSTPPNPWGNSNPPSNNTWSSPAPQPPVSVPNPPQTTFPPWNPTQPPQNTQAAPAEPITNTIPQNPSPFSTTPEPSFPQSPVQTTPQVQPDLSASINTFPPQNTIAQNQAAPVEPSFFPSQSSTTTSPLTSPLDNPWAAPSQPPQINGGTPPQWPNANTSPSEEAITTQAPPAPEASAPTDLSHLITNNNQPDENPNVQNAETLVVPSTPTPELPTNPVTSSGGIPKWLIGVGIGLLILVAGASAYFILGVGRPPEVTTSIPAEVEPPKEVKDPTPVATPPQQAPAEEGSANFGELEGNSTTSGQTPSAIDAARQRQQTGQ